MNRTISIGIAVVAAAAFVPLGRAAGAPPCDSDNGGITLPPGF